MATSATAAAHAEANARQPSRVPAPPNLLRPPVVRRPAGPVTVQPPIGSDTSQSFDTGATTDADLLQQLLAPSYLQNDQALAREQETERRNQAVYAGLTQALMHELGGIPAAVQGDYNTMQQQTLSMANASADRLAAANPNADTQSLMSAVDAPAAQGAAVAGQNQAVFAGGGALLAGTQGFLPAETLAKVGAAQTAYARGLPAVAALQGSRALQQLAYQSQQDRQSIFDQRAQIDAQGPKLLMDIQSQRATEADKQRALDMEAAAFGLKTQGQAFNQNATLTRLNQSAASLKLRAAQASTANNLRYAEVYGYDPRTGKPTLAAIKAAQKDKQKAKKPPTAAARKNWETFADTAFHGVAPKTHYDSATGAFIRVPGTGQPPLQYYAALKRLIAMGATLGQAQNTLNAFYAKGEGGRPHVSLQGRVALQKAGMPMTHPTDVPTAAQKRWLQQHGLWSD
jgi:hypothetical protein